jgi:hypothetical protein
MSDIGETFKAFKEERRIKRWGNFDSSIGILKSKNIPHVVCNSGNGHVLVCNDIDFWPTTGRWRRRVFNHQGRGIKRLLSYIERQIKIESQQEAQAECDRRNKKGEG